MEVVEVFQVLQVVGVVPQEAEVEEVGPRVLHAVVEVGVEVEGPCQSVEEGPQVVGVFLALQKEFHKMTPAFEKNIIQTKAPPWIGGT